MQRSLFLAAVSLALAPLASSQITVVEDFPLDFVLSVVSGPSDTDITPDLPGQVSKLVIQGGGTMTARISAIAWWDPVANYTNYSYLDLYFSNAALNFAPFTKYESQVPRWTYFGFQHTESAVLAGGAPRNLGTDGRVRAERIAPGDDLIWVMGQYSYGGAYTTFEANFVGNLQVTWQPDPLPFVQQCAGSSTAESYGDRDRFYLHAHGTPPDEWSMWVVSDLPGSSGPFCIGAPVVRVPSSLKKTTAAGETTFHYEDLHPPVGQTLYFQLWHRLPAGGSDVSDGIAVTF